MGGKPPSALNPYELANMRDMGNVNWLTSSALTRLTTIATVCNKARFSDAAPEGGWMAF